MPTSFRSILACLALAATGLAYACGDSSGGAIRPGGDTGGGSGGATGGTTTTGSTGTATTGTATTGTATTGTATTGTATGATTGTTMATTTTGAAGAAATTTGMAGTGGSTGSGGAGGAGGASLACGSNGQPYTGPLLGRCAVGCTDMTCGTSVGKGGFLTLDDFEIVSPGVPITGTATINMTWSSRDGRNGAWHSYADPLSNSAMSLEPTGGGGSTDSVQAMHYKGIRGAYGATLALPLGGAAASGMAGCYDASAYDGISFWIKGTAAAGNTQVKFNVQSPVSEPVLTGGACVSGCYDHFSMMVSIPAAWTRVKIPWADLKRQACAASMPATPPNFQPEKQILAVSFQQVDPTKGFDFWIDDIRFDVDTKPATDFAHTVTQPIYDEMFKTATAPYTYAGFVAAVASHGAALAKNPNAVDNKREAAAFLAHIAHETGSLTTAHEKCVFTCSMGLATGCIGTEPTRACTMGNTYFGRGALQLTGVANYTSAQSAGFAGIVATPELVATNVDFAFGTAVWFWMNPQSAVGVCHTAIVGGDFGQTTRIINGLECGGTLQDSRVALYRQFCAALGINLGGNTRC